MVIRREKCVVVRDFTWLLPKESISHIEPDPEGADAAFFAEAHLQSPEKSRPEEQGTRERKNARAALVLASFAALTSIVSAIVTAFTTYTGLLG